MMKTLSFTTIPDSVAEVVMETAFFYAETTKNTKRSWKILDTLAQALKKPELLAGHNRDLEGFHQVLHKLSPTHAEGLWNRYFPVMVTVEGGFYTLIDSDYQDTTVVSLNTYQIAKTEVSRWQYFLYCKSTGVKFPTTWLYDGSKPITNVSWFDALKYANWLSKRMKYTPVYPDNLNGRPLNSTHASADSTTALDSLDIIPYNSSANGYRLPTEAQWEYAASGGKLTKKYRYAGSNTLDDVAWNASNSKGISQPVGMKMPNELGLYDMTGNVWEWCWDWHDRYNFTSNVDPIGPPHGTTRVMRGASREQYEDTSTIHKRQNNLPDFKDRGILGFRLARNVEK
jgi:formylglycine-generating enzyme required for sulfatase activity